MNLVGYTATALSRNDIEDTPTNKNVVDFAIVELKDLQGNLAVMYDDVEGANPETQKTCDTNGQVTFFAEAGDYDLEINGKAQRINLAANIADYIKLGTGESVQEFADSFALKVFQSPTDGGLTEIQTRTVDANEVYEVRKTSDDSLATIYSDAAGTNEIVQNGTDNKSGSDGIVEFYISDGDYYVEVGGVRGGLLVLRLKPFLTVADMTSASYLSKYAEGTRIEWQGYYEQSDGGGNWGVLKFGAHTEDGGSIFSIDSNTYIEANLKGKRFSVLKFGARGETSFLDNTPYFEAAKNACPVGGEIYIPTGEYKFQKPELSDYHLIWDRNVSIKGDGARTTRLLGYGITEAMVKVAITENGGLLDVRGWGLEGVGMQNIDGKHCVEFGGGMPMSQCYIGRNGFTPGLTGATTETPNYCLNIRNQLSHSLIELNGFGGPCYLGLFDANKVSKNTSFGRYGFAYTLDCELGVYNNTIDSNTIVNRDGALHVINGSVVRFTNNQCEQFQAYGLNESQPSTMLWIQGADRPAVNIVVRDNNFGGGSNVDYLMYFENTNKASISCNRLNPSAEADIYIASDCKYVCDERDNYQSSSISDPRDDIMFRTKIENYSLYSVGVPLDLSAYTKNGWTFSGTQHAYRTKEGKLVFIAALNGGTTAPGALMLQLNNALRPRNSFSSVAIKGSAAAIEANCSVLINNVGSFVDVTLNKSLPSNSGIIIDEYLLNNTDTH